MLAIVILRSISGRHQVDRGFLKPFAKPSALPLRAKLMPTLSRTNPCAEWGDFPGVILTNHDSKCHIASVLKNKRPPAVLFEQPCGVKFLGKEAHSRVLWMDPSAHCAYLLFNARANLARCSHFRWFVLWSLCARRTARRRESAEREVAYV